MEDNSVQNYIHKGGMQESATMAPEAPDTTANEEAPLNDNANQEELEASTTVRDIMRSSVVSIGTAMRGSVLEELPPAPEEETIGKGASQAVLCLRILVLLVLLASALAVSFAIKDYLRDAEQKDFETQFISDANKVMDTMGKNMADTLETTDAFIQKLVVYAHYSNKTFPFVTLPGFPQQAMKALKITKGLNIVFYPKVLPSQQEEWENYASENSAWVDEGFDVMEKDEDWKLPIDRDYDVSPTLYGLNGPYEPYNSSLQNTYPPFYTPAWQNAPSAPKALVGYPYNYDFASNPIYRDALEHAIENQSAIMYPSFSGIVYNESDPLEVQLADIYWAFAREFLDPSENEKEPFITVIIPVFNVWDSVRVDRSRPNEFVGSLVSSVYVREFLRNLLPSNSRGILTSFENCRGEIFTYEINGDTPSFYGVGVQHEAKYEDLAFSSTLGNLVKDSNLKRKSRYSGLPLTDETCTFTLNVYPTQEMEDTYVTNKPALYAGLVALVFVFTSFVFVCYDVLVAHRQKIVLARALASGAIVSSLFPEKVRQQLYEEKRQEQSRLKQQQNNHNNLKKSGDSERATLTNVLASTGSRNNALPKSQPIADLFHNTTIFFADLVGFTGWSSTRSPTEVFQLLEAIFHAFDQIAARRRVFKVETIGDCYVAVTGIPDPQPDHAVIMCKFSSDCIAAMKNVVHDLVETLGEETATLDMRVGLHSGSTTAGVLRGERGRFQLFGDTVNTASRMESNGVKGRIQVSQTTADSLIAKGKALWLTPREEKVMAKGKGEMQTYFVSTGGTSTAHSKTSLISDGQESAND